LKISKCVNLRVYAVDQSWLCSR